MKKTLIPSIYLFQGKAVAGLHNEIVVLSDDPVSYAETITDAGADALLVFDLSTGDEEHETSLDLIKAISSEVDVPLIGAGNVNRMEDIKKLLYAGCKKAALNFSKPGNVEILKEVSDKFGKDKIAICAKSGDPISLNADSIREMADLLILLPTPDKSSVELAEKAEIMPVPCIVCADEGQISDMEDVCKILAHENVSGVSGTAIQSFDLLTLRKAVTDHGMQVPSWTPAFTWENLKKNNDGQVPVVVQDYRTDEVLMVAYMNKEAYDKTLETGRMTYFSRSRNSLWLKGETSGHYQYVKSLTADCDLDTILAKVKQIGAACHTGSRSCFFNEIAAREYQEKNPQKVLDSVFKVILDRKVNPREGSYTNYLFDKGIDKILKKCGEEATEIVIAAKNPNRNEVVYEMSDFLYHMMVLMAEKGVSWEEVTDELARR